MKATRETSKDITDSRREHITKRQNTFAKRQREAEKRAKADAKRARRLERKQSQNTQEAPGSVESFSKTEGETSENRPA